MAVGLFKCVSTTVAAPPVNGTRSIAPAPESVQYKSWSGTSSASPKGRFRPVTRSCAVPPTWARWNGRRDYRLPASKHDFKRLVLDVRIVTLALTWLLRAKTE